MMNSAFQDGEHTISFFGNPGLHPPEACGHMINDAKDTQYHTNCIETPLCGGSVTAILVTRPVKKGEELFMAYGEGYWKGVKNAS
jgi:hypothetical protein